MISFTTPIQITPSAEKIDHTQGILSVGSCFADNIALRMRDGGFNVYSNPFGTLYNPASINTCIQWMNSADLFSEDMLVQQDGLWHSMLHHGSFSNPERGICLDNINRALEATRRFMHDAHWVIITLGTAWVYELDGKIVGNCHKIPANRFDRRRLTVDEVTALLEQTIQQLGQKHILLTVSPIRHKGDGMHENQLSKATLLLAVDSVVKLHPSCCYFPSYEIMMDELRDYRFTAADMIHPTDTAVDYIWQRFQDTFFTPQTREYAAQQHRLSLRQAHRPLHTF
ncbi:MAG: GSCFA domain-containing protein [Paludibacteraceae bacterium]|nr:GSCFA domain-containing protein [Paludibacteraceae bacterium]